MDEPIVLICESYIVHEVVRCCWTTDTCFLMVPLGSIARPDLYMLVSEAVCFVAPPPPSLTSPQCVLMSRLVAVSSQPMRDTSTKSGSTAVS